MYFQASIKNFSISSLLTYAGSLPFVLAAILMYWDFERLPLIGDVQKVIDVYGLVIVVFIAGSYWGFSFRLVGTKRTALMIMSHFLILIAFFSYTWLENVPFQLVLVVLLIAMLLVDYWLYFLKLSSQDYVLLRLIVSMIVIASLYIVFSS